MFPDGLKSGFIKFYTNTNTNHSPFPPDVKILIR